METTKPNNNIIYEDEFIFIELTGKKPKTDIYTVFSKCSDCDLGEIRWYPSWRHYCFFPSYDISTVYSDRCLLAISQTITKLNQEHKELLNSLGDGK